jgi:16S rRNA (cytidine1402-2'-O)-methyltransferase
MSGTLYIVATPIGNLNDISPRALDILRHTSLIACEDTRTTGKLLARYSIQTRTISYHEHNEKRRAVELVDKLLRGQDIALVSDAGTPGISDPGYRLVNEARQKEVSIRTVPGPSAMLAALAVSGLPTSSFCFVGFLPVKPGARRKALDSVASSPHTVVVFESCRRAPGLLRDLALRLGHRRAFVAREMTKIHEEHKYGTLPELAEWSRSSSLRGELTLVISAPESGRTTAPGALTKKAVVARFQELTQQGLTRRQAVKMLAREQGRPSRQIYDEVLSLHTSKPRGNDENS